MLKGQFGNMRAIIVAEQHRLVDNQDMAWLQILAEILVELDCLYGYIFSGDSSDIPF